MEFPLIDLKLRLRTPATEYQALRTVGLRRVERKDSYEKTSLMVYIRGNCRGDNGDIAGAKCRDGLEHNRHEHD